MATSDSRPTGMLDNGESAPWTDTSFFAETVTLLRDVQDHDLDTLAALCDDISGIVDLERGGPNVVVRTRQNWESRIQRLFGELDAAVATTDSPILNHNALTESDLGFSVLEFRQSLQFGEHAGSFDCVATIVWKQTHDGWREAPWHVSLLSADIPDALVA